jgi:HUS1 checkpoint protein
MRFRTVISNVSLLHSQSTDIRPYVAHKLIESEIVKALHALAKTCVIRLTPDKVHFIVPGNEGKEGVQVWS